MKVLVACEFSGLVRDAFLAAGHTAMSCDLLPCERPGPHHQGDVRELLDASWDLMIAHPPCTDLAVSGARWFAAKSSSIDNAVEFVRTLMLAPIPRIAIENPVGVLSTRLRPPDQIIHPWQFGHGEVKTTCLWLKGLPLLRPTLVVAGREPRIWYLPPSACRAQERSRTYPGIATAMASQWSSGVIPQPELEFA